MYFSSCCEVQYNVIDLILPIITHNASAHFITRENSYAPNTNNKYMGQGQGKSDMILVFDTSHQMMHLHTNYK